MLSHYFIKVLLGDFVAYFIHGRYYIVLSDASRPIRVKLVEDSLQLIIIHEVLNVKRGHQELRIVYLFISEVIHLIYYLIDLFVC